MTLRFAVVLPFVGGQSAATEVGSVFVKFAQSIFAGFFMVAS